MDGEKRKREIKDMIKDYKKLLDLHEYKTTSRFKTTYEDNDLRGCYAMVRVDKPNKNIYLRFSKWDSVKMNKKGLKKLVLHELLHSFFWELSDLFDDSIKKCDITDRQKELLRERYENIENRKIDRLTKVVVKLDRLESRLR